MGYILASRGGPQAGWGYLLTYEHVSFLIRAKAIASGEEGIGTSISMPEQVTKISAEVILQRRHRG